MKAVDYLILKYGILKPIHLIALCIVVFHLHTQSKAKIRYNILTQYYDHHNYLGPNPTHNESCIFDAY